MFENIDSRILVYVIAGSEYEKQHKLFYESKERVKELVESKNLSNDLVFIQTSVQKDSVQPEDPSSNNNDESNTPKEDNDTSDRQSALQRLAAYSNTLDMSHLVDTPDNLEQIYESSDLVELLEQDVVYKLYESSRFLLSWQLPDSNPEETVILPQTPEPSPSFSTLLSGKTRKSSKKRKRKKKPSKGPRIRLAGITEQSCHDTLMSGNNAVINVPLQQLEQVLFHFHPQFNIKVILTDDQDSSESTSSVELLQSNSIEYSHVSLANIEDVVSLLLGSEYLKATVISPSVTERPFSHNVPEDVSFVSRDDAIEQPQQAKYIQNEIYPKLLPILTKMTRLAQQGHDDSITDASSDEVQAMMDNPLLWLAEHIKHLDENDQ